MTPASQVDELLHDLEVEDDREFKDGLTLGSTRSNKYDQCSFSSSVATGYGSKVTKVLHETHQGIVEQLRKSLRCFKASLDYNLRATSS